MDKKSGNTFNKHWDNIYVSGEYKKLWEYKYPSQELVTAVSYRIIPDKGTVLDVGCGTGTEAMFLAECGFKSFGLDISKEALKIAEKRANKLSKNVTWLLGNVLDIPLENCFVDFINDRGCFHHIVDSDRKDYAEEVRRVLKPGGSILIRGSRKNDDGYFVVVDEVSIDSNFSQTYFERGPILPISLISDEGDLPSNIVMLRKVSDICKIIREKY